MNKLVCHNSLHCGDAQRCFRSHGGLGKHERICVGPPLMQNGVQPVRGQWLWDKGRDSGCCSWSRFPQAAGSDISLPQGDGLLLVAILGIH